MEQLIDLRCRNTALETELRLVKEQLAQAHGATSYLVTSLSNQQAQREYSETDRLQARLDKALAENAQLRTYLRSNHAPIPHPQHQITAPWYGQQEATRQQSQSILPPTPQSIITQTLDLDDLLSFEDGDVPAASGLQSPASPPAWRFERRPQQTYPDSSAILRHPEKSREGAIGLGISYPNTSLEDGTPPRDTLDGDDPNVQLIKHADGTTSRITLTPEEPRIGNNDATPLHDSPHIPTGPRWEFEHFERRLLLDKAVFIEDMDHDAYAAYWKQMSARSRGKHNPQEWQDYYEQVVLPDFNKQQAAIADDRDQCPDGDEDNSISVDRGDVAPMAEVSGLEEAAVTGEEDVNSQGGSDHVIDEADPRVGNASDSDDGRSDSGEEATHIQSQPKPAASLDDTPGGQKDDHLVRSPQAAVKELQEPTLAPADTCSMSAKNGVMRVDETPQPDAVSLQTVEEYCREYQERPTHLNVDTEATMCAGSAADESKITRPTTPTMIPPRHGHASRRAAGHDNHQSQDKPVVKRRCCDEPTHEIRYVHPKYPTDLHDPTMFRTVKISNIPPKTTLAEILNKVRGGPIVSAIYLSTSEMRVKPPIETNEVLVTFSFSDRAQAFADYCTQQHNIFFWSEKWNAPFKATVTHVKAPIQNSRQWPQYQSRVLFLQDHGDLIPWIVIKEVFTINHRRERVCGYPLRTGRDKDGILFFEFASIEDAQCAKLAVEDVTWEIPYLTSGYFPDPCSRPLHSLQDVAEAVKPTETPCCHAVEVQRADSPLCHVQSNYTTSKQPLEDVVLDKQAVADTSLSNSTTAAIAETTPTKTLPNPWANFGDLEAAKSIRAGVKRNYARGTLSMPRGILLSEAQPLRIVEGANAAVEADAAKEADGAVDDADTARVDAVTVTEAAADAVKEADARYTEG